MQPYEYRKKSPNLDLVFTTFLWSLPRFPYVSIEWAVWRCDHMTSQATGLDARASRGNDLHSLCRIGMVNYLLNDDDNNNNNNNDNNDDDNDKDDDNRNNNNNDNDYNHNNGANNDNNENDNDKNSSDSMPVTV